MKTSVDTEVAGNAVECIPIGLGLQQKSSLPVFPIIHSVIGKK